MKVKHFLPRPIYRMISTWRTFCRNQERSRRMDAEHAVQLGERHLRNLVVLPDRTEMLRRMPQGGVACEVGVAEGEFSRQILDLTRPSRLHLIDLWSSDLERYAESMQPALDRVRPELDSGLVQVHRGYSWDMLATLADRSLDWVYIDAAHDYEYVRKDIAAAVPKMKPDGLICGHDYTRWSMNGLNRWGVVEAVNELCLNDDWEFVWLTHEPHRHASFAIRKIRS